MLSLDEGIDNEPREACQTAGTGPHWWQGEIQSTIPWDMQEYMYILNTVPHRGQRVERRRSFTGQLPQMTRSSSSP